ncbi:MAG: hypothetical protein H6736_01570 [Alphaproteobacteria bacterium]|nr:hypothetical protein [Alphaproteobacteria bacterium]
MSGTATLSWSSDVGFELDLTADLEDIRLRFAAVPVPADGTAELAEGVELNKLDVLFKCQAVIDGAPAQLQDAKITVASGKLRLDAHLEDVENGLLYPLETELDCPIPKGVPERGGVRNISPDEDELDWGDETTFEAIAGDVPDAALLTEEFDADDPSSEEASESPGPTGLAALLAALKNLPEEDDASDVPPPEDEPETFVPPPAAPGDQKMTPIQEAVGFLEVLIGREELELEEDYEASDLASGVAHILQLPLGDAAKASRLSEWLLEQPEVADLFIDDESLAQIVAEW